MSEVSKNQPRVVKRIATATGTYLVEMVAWLTRKGTALSPVLQIKEVKPAAGGKATFEARTFDDLPEVDKPIVAQAVMDANAAHLRGDWDHAIAGVEASNQIAD